MSNAYALATLNLPNPTFLRIGGGTIGQVLTSTGLATGTVVWGAGGGGGGGAVATDGTSIVGDGVGTPLSVGTVSGAEIVRRSSW